jgi:hypothetical protein
MKIHPLLLVPLSQRLTLAVTSTSSQADGFVARDQFDDLPGAVPTAGTRYSFSLRPCEPEKVSHVVSLASHGIETS